MKSVFDHVFIKYNKKKKSVYYVVHTQYKYFSLRYGKWVHCHVCMKSDGATNAMDIDSFSWLVHDKICDIGLFQDGTKCTNKQASMIISDILKSEGKWFRAKTWFVATWLFGGGKARKNGLL
tara:strand:- start:561 stop:926 length:366 start_codon:yes stop_codon:yes gene_type:complete